MIDTAESQDLREPGILATLGGPYRPLIAAFVGRAIALAWDHGRIGFPNESHLPFRDEVAGILGRMAGREPDEIRPGIAILTTNFGTTIDSAFKRRLSFRLTLPFPDEEAREALWRSHLPPQLPRLGHFDLADLARRYRLSGGYIRNAAVRAAFLAAEEQTLLTQDHLERAIRAGSARSARSPRAGCSSSAAQRAAAGSRSTAK